MKKLRITVDQHVYDVEVEVLEDDGAPPGVAVRHGEQPVGPAPRPAAARAVRPSPAPAIEPSADAITAPIAGTVKRVLVAIGDVVEVNAPVVQIEAMKMETTIQAPRGGAIREACVQPGDAVRVGDALLRFELAGMT